MLSGAYFHAEGAFPLDLFKHGCVSAHPGHLGHLVDRDDMLPNRVHLTLTVMLHTIVRTNAIILLAKIIGCWTLSL